MTIQERLETLVKELDDIEKQKHEAAGYTHPHNMVHWTVRKKFYAIDIGERSIPNRGVYWGNL